MGLAKPFEVLLANNSPTTLLPTSFDLPIRDAPRGFEYGFYCVDPHDGYARFSFQRPVRPGRTQATDDRIPYCTLLLPIDAEATPLMERLNVSVDVDHDLIVRVRAWSAAAPSEVSEAEIHGLEFGLAVGGAT